MFSHRHAKRRLKPYFPRQLLAGSVRAMRAAGGPAPTAKGRGSPSPPDEAAVPPFPFLPGRSTAPPNSLTPPFEARPRPLRSHWAAGAARRLHSGRWVALPAPRLPALSPQVHRRVAAAAAVRVVWGGRCAPPCASCLPSAPSTVRRVAAASGLATGKGRCAAGSGPQLPPVLRRVRLVACPLRGAGGGGRQRGAAVLREQGSGGSGGSGCGCPAAGLSLEAAGAAGRRGAGTASCLPFGNGSLNKEPQCRA